MVRSRASLDEIKHRWQPRYAESNRGNCCCKATCSEQMPATKLCYHRANIIMSFQSGCSVRLHAFESGGSSTADLGALRGGPAEKRTLLNAALASAGLLKPYSDCCVRVVDPVTNVPRPNQVNALQLLEPAGSEIPATGKVRRSPMNLSCAPRPFEASPVRW